MATIIRPTTPDNHIMPEATPSKKVSNDTRCTFTCSHHASQAAAALQAISFESPTKPIHLVLSSTTLVVLPSPLSETEKAEDRELILRKHFVGDIDLPESTSGNCVSYLPLTSFVGQEPLLMESKCRFVLFSI